jgi:hypothetical protein
VKSGSLALQDLPDPVLPAEVTKAFDVAYENIRAFHTAQRSEPLEVETMPGVRCRCVAQGWCCALPRLSAVRGFHGWSPIVRAGA